MTENRPAPTIKRPLHPRKPVVFFDMDGVCADYDAYASSAGLTLGEAAEKQGTFLWLQPVPGAIQLLRMLLDQNLFEPYFASKPCVDSPASYTEKVLWVERHAPFMRERIVLTQNKGLLGGPEDFLIDDRPHKAFCERFRGTLIQFPYGDFSFWTQIARLFSGIDARSPAHAAEIVRERLADAAALDRILAHARTNHCSMPS